MWLGQRSARSPLCRFIVLGQPRRRRLDQSSAGPPRQEPLSAVSGALRALSRRTWHFSRHSSRPKIIFCRRTIFRRTPKPSWRIALRRQILGCICSPRSPPAILAGWERGMRWSAWEATLDTMGKLEMFRGHLYNWYDTRDLRPLDPKYISTVDSGNIAGHLLALANGCRELIQNSLVRSVLKEDLKIRHRVFARSAAGVQTRPRAFRDSETTSQCRGLPGASMSIQPARHARDWARKLSSVRARADASRHCPDARPGTGRGPSRDVRAGPRPARACAESQCGTRGSCFRGSGWAPGKRKRWLETRLGRRPEWKAIEAFFPHSAALADAPERFEGRIRELAALRAGSTSDPARTDARIRMCQRGSMPH